MFPEKTDYMMQSSLPSILHTKIAISMVSNAITNAPMNASINPIEPLNLHVYNPKGKIALLFRTEKVMLLLFLHVFFSVFLGWRTG